MEEYEQTLDQEYGQCLQQLRDLVPGLVEPIEIKTTAQWIERFNRTPPEEKVLRNRCVKLLLRQLLEDNLTYPFIFQRYLEEPLEMLLQHDPEIVGDSSSLKPLQQLVQQLETLNERTDDDICSLRNAAAESKPDLTQCIAKDVNYLILFQNTLRSALLLTVPEIIANPEYTVPAIGSEKLQSNDREWLTIVLEGIRAKANSMLWNASQRHMSPTSSSVECQTDGLAERTAARNVNIDRAEIERYLERKFEKLYANFRVREKALEIRTQTAGGMHLIDVSQRLVRQYRRSMPTSTRPSKLPVDRNRRRSDN
uniref:Uncharacterized protein n=1 Tax=Anopheles farauti TaxID=69004 RepID=A0A182QGS4_9DIPT